MGFTINNIKIHTYFTTFILVCLLAYPITASHEYDPTEEDGFEPFFTLYDLLNWNTQGDVKHEVIADAFSHIGIDVRLDFSSDPNKRLWGSGIPIPSYDEGGFDYTTKYLVRDLQFNDGICYEWEGIDCFMESWFGYDNTGFYDKMLEFHDTYNRIDRQKIYEDAMEIIKDEIPYLAIGQQFRAMAFADGFEITENQKIGLALTIAEAAIYSRGWAKLDYPGTDTLVIADYLDRSIYDIPLLPFSFPAYSLWSGNFNYPSLVFQSLYERSYEDEFDWAPLIADGMPTLSDDKTLLTVNIKENITFADGVELTSEDVVESYRMLYTLGKDRVFLFTDILDDTDSIYALDEYTVQFELSSTTPFYMGILKLPIYPIHTWGNHTEVAPWWEIQDQLVADLQANGTSQYGFGTGPFVYSGLKPMDTISTIVQNVTYTRNSNYWDGDVNLNKIVIDGYKGLQSEIIPKLKTGEIHIAADRILQYSSWSTEKKLFDQLDAEGLSYTRVPTQVWHYLFINMYHPILGTGLDTPLGKEDPGKAGLAAKYVRKAMDHALPRDFLWDSEPPITNGRGISRIEELPDVFEHTYNIMDAEYNITLAQEYMELAGYEFPEDPNPQDGLTSNIASDFTASKIEQANDQMLLPVIFSFLGLSLFRRIRRVKR